VWDVRFLSDSKKLSVTADSEEDNLVDGMGFEYSRLLILRKLFILCCAKCAKSAN
jgi:hypothetical protein